MLSVSITPHSCRSAVRVSDRTFDVLSFLYKYTSFAVIILFSFAFLNFFSFLVLVSLVYDNNFSIKKVIFLEILTMNFTVDLLNGELLYSLVL